MKKCGIKPGDNIFNYSILIDKEFGDNSKQDAIKLIHEIRNNKDLRKEPKIIFKINNELIEQRLQKSLGNKNKALMKRLITKNDYGIDGVKNGKKNFFKNIIKKKNNNIKNKKNSITKRESISIDLKTEDNFLNKQNKLNIKKIQDNLENISNEFINSYKNKKNILEKNLNIYDYNYNITNKHFNTERNYKPKSVSKIEKKNELLKDSNNNSFSTTNLNINKNLYENKKKSVISKLPKINTSEEIKNLNITTSTTTYYSSDRNNKKLCIPTQPNNSNKNEKKIIFNNKSESKVLSNKNFENPIKLNDLKNKNIKKNRLKNNYVSFLESFLIRENDKKIMTEKELNNHISKFKEKNNPLLQSFRKKKLKMSNLHGFASNLQRVTTGKDFGILHLKNKLLKKNNYSNLKSSYYEINDEKDDNNIHDIDKKISNIYYDSANFILCDSPHSKIFEKNNFFL